MQINRLFEIIYLLMDKKRMTALELANHFEVSKRTILRDVETLSGAGIPIYTMPGRGGGIAILDHYILNKTVITEAEQKQILVALQGMSATKHLETNSILGRLQSLFDTPKKDWIEVDFSRWGNNAAEKAKFEALKNAIINEHYVSFTYSSSTGETFDRKIAPLKLVFKSMSWYLQAFCTLKDEYRIFKISRMRDIEIFADTFDGKAYQAPETPTDWSSANVISLKLFFEPQMAFRVYDEFEEECITKNADGSFTVVRDYPDTYWVYDYLLSFGTTVEILEPESARQEIVRLAGELKNKYSGKDDT